MSETGTSGVPHHRERSSYSESDVDKSSERIAEVANEMRLWDHALPKSAGYGVGLSLSGGGFRASLFHLGVIEALRERDLLKKVRVITSVSGGSIVAAHLVLNWERYALSSNEDFESARQEVLDFIYSSPRTEILAWLPITLANVVCQKILRFTQLGLIANRLGQPTNTGKLAKIYDKRLYKRKTLSDLAGDNRPELSILACNLTSVGANSFFDSLGYMPSSDSGCRAPCTDLPVAHAVTASSAFPMLFEPYVVTPDSIGVNNNQLMPGTQALTDGGVFDNLGVHRLLHIASNLKDSRPLDQIIVSDASGAMDLDRSTLFRNAITRLTRVSEVLYRQANELTKEKLHNNPKSTIIQISNSLADHPLTVQQQNALEFIRTDLDRFSPIEVAALQEHGYLVAHQALSTSNNGSLPEPTSLISDRPSQRILKSTEQSQIWHTLKNGKRRSIRWRLLLFRPTSFIHIAIASIMLTILLLSAQGIRDAARDALGLYLFGIEPSSISEFLITEPFPLKIELMSSHSNMYFVGLVNYYTLTNFAEPMANAINEGVSINFFLYLPEEQTPGIVSKHDLETYVSNFRRYRPHAEENWEIGLKNFWGTTLNPEQALYGRSAANIPTDQIDKHYTQKYYDDRPIGWLVVFDATDGFEDARSIYWYPYLSQAKEMDRPGIRVSADSELGQELLKWLRRINESGVRTPTKESLNAWKNAIISIDDQSP